MLLCVQHIMFDPPLFKEIAQPLGIFYGNCTNQYRLTGFMSLCDSVGDGLKLIFLFGKNSIIKVFPYNRFVGRNYHYIHIVNVTEFLFLCFCGTCHSGQLVIHSEVVLKSDGSKGFGLRTHQNAFLCLDCLVEPVAVSSSEHETACKFINNDDFSILYYIVHIPFHYGSGFKSFQNVMVYFHVFRVTEVFNVKEFFRFGHACVCQTYSLFLFFNCEIIFLFQGFNKSVCNLIKIRRLVSLSGNNQRCSCFINKNGVHLVDDGIIKVTLSQLALVNYHIVAEVIEAELVIGSVCYISLISGLSCLV